MYIGEFLEMLNLNVRYDCLEFMTTNLFENKEGEMC